MLPLAGLAQPHIGILSLSEVHLSLEFFQTVIAETVAAVRVAPEFVTLAVADIGVGQLEERRVPERVWRPVQPPQRDLLPRPDV